MLKIEVSIAADRRHIELDARGGMDEIVGDLLSAVRAMYSGFSSQDESGAALFRKLLCEAFRDPQNRIFRTDGHEEGLLICTVKEKKGDMQHD